MPVVACSGTTPRQPVSGYYYYIAERCARTPVPWYHDTFCTALRTLCLLVLCNNGQVPFGIQKVSTGNSYTSYSSPWVQVHAGLKFPSWLTWRIAEFLTWINKHTNLSRRLNEVKSIFWWLQGSGTCKNLLLIKQVPELFIWVFSDPAAGFPCIPWSQLHPLPRF